MRIIFTMSSVYPLNNEHKLTTLEEANELAPKLLFLRKRLTALALDSVVVGFLSPTLLAVTTLCLSAMSQGAFTLDLNLKMLAITFLLGAVDALTGGVLIAVVFGWFVVYLFTPWVSLFDTRTIFFGAVCAMVANHFYYVLFERSLLQATPGKLAMGLKVSGTNGAPLTPQQTAFRHSTKILSTFAIILAPITLVIFCNRRQLIHDRLAGSLVDVNGSVLVPTNAVEAGVNLTSASLSTYPARENCAGIPRRIVSAGIDSLVYYVCEGVTIVSIVLLMANFLPLNFHWFSDPLTNEVLALLVIGLIASLPGIAVPMLVFAAFESSNLQASPGKMITGMRVVNAAGAKTTFSQAFEKQCIQGFIYMSLFPTCSFALLLIAFLKAPPFWAMLAFAVFYLVYGSVLCFTFGSGQTLVDRWSQRYIVLEQTSQNESLILKDRGALL